ncbi:MAG TPA: limonene-1,2-epoxide hydrolase family protein [Acidimicrobiales bacterium]|nr:limonene-1,2-epoxide hydrolase family protein [Acidimicrobiales bacterium]
MTEALDVVTGFCAAWSKLDIDRIMSSFTPDAVYHNIPIDALEGTDAIRAMIESFTAGWDRVDFEIRTIVAQGSVVMTERVDHFVSAERTISLPVMGVFELEGDRIRAWRDYFDLNQFMNQMAG